MASLVKEIAMSKFYDVVLGWPGVVVFVILVCVGVAMTTSPDKVYSTKSECEQAGGVWVQSMKSYHSCKFSIKN